MRPIDPRLLRLGRATRGFLVLSVVLGGAVAALVIAQAGLLARIVTGAFQQGDDLDDLRLPIAALLAVVVARAGVTAAQEIAAHRSSARVKSELRGALVQRLAAGGVPAGRTDSGAPPGSPGAGTTGGLAALATRGIDALDGYFARYLPQLVLAVVVPVAILLVVAALDWVSAVIILLTLPLIPIFMILIGWATQARTDRQLGALQVLSGHFLDVVSGLPTLRLFGRSKAQEATIRAVTDQYRRTTMATLRLAFLSSLVLELLASVAVALVAVAIGLRLLHGHLDLEAGLFVLILAPEAYLPLRQVGGSFHASAEGLSAADQVLGLLAQPLPARGTGTVVPDPRREAIVVEDLTVAYPGRAVPALAGLSLRVEPGEVVAVTGPSGAGKSTLVAVLLGFVVPSAGRVRIGSVDLATLDPDAWRSQVAWVPQQPHLFATTIEANVRLGRPDASAAEVRHAVEAAGLAPVVDALPDGLATTLGEGGAGLSVGERRRVALARAVLRDAPVLLLDEPTAGLDAETEASILAAVADLAQGRTVLLVAHRASLVALADREVPLDAAPVRT